MIIIRQGIPWAETEVSIFGKWKRKDLIVLKTRTCPFCGKEISEEAILCKFCHNLLIDENGKDIEPQYEEPEQEQPAEEENTIVYSKEELKKGYGAG